MFDAVNISQIPSGPRAVAGYTAGLFITYPVLIRRFPHAIVKSIAIGWGWRAQCLDVEPLDAIPAQVVAWIRVERAVGFAKPCVYSSIWEYVHNIRPLLAAAHIPRSSIFEWDADYTHVRHLDAGFDATQWTDRAYGRNLDESTVTLAFLGIKPTPSLPICIHHRLTRSKCAAAHRQIASAQRGLSSSQRAYTARECPTLARRVSWYSTRLKRHPHIKTASRKRALALSRRAYRQRSCSLFKGRSAFFSAVVLRTEAGN
jgi:hypothetical protein